MIRVSRPSKRVMILIAVAIAGAAITTTGIRTVAAMTSGPSAVTGESTAVVTGPAAGQARAAALTAVPGGRAGVVDRDAEGGYLVTVTKPDGSQVTVRLSQVMTVISVGPASSGDNGDGDGDGG